MKQDNPELFLHRIKNDLGSTISSVKSPRVRQGYTLDGIQVHHRIRIQYNYKSDIAGTSYRLPKWAHGHKVITLLFVVGEEIANRKSPQGLMEIALVVYQSVTEQLNTFYFCLFVIYFNCICLFPDQVVGKKVK